MEVNDFISIMYATLVRFYLPAIQIEDLEEITQDLIELATSLSIDGALSHWLIKMCRMTLKDEEQQLRAKLRDLKDIKIEQIGINSMFTCNETSRLMVMLKDCYKK